MAIMLVLGDSTLGYVTDQLCVVLLVIYFILMLLSKQIQMCVYVQSKEEKHFIHNHLAFTVKFHRDPVTELARIVGFEVKTYRL